MQETSISYHISFVEPQAHYAEVKVDIKNFPQEYIDLKMPVWTPGSYLVREYSRHVENFYAIHDAEQAVLHEKTSKNTWRVHHQGQDITVHYRLYGFETSVRTNFIDDQHAFLSSAATFMYIDGYLDHPVTVHIEQPEYWTKISTGLTKTDEANTFYAADFDILFDSPIEIGNQDVWTFEAAGVPHEFAMVGGGNYDKDKLSKDITKIVEEETKLWGSNPNDRYVFVTHNYQHAAGGLEHLNSTILAASRNAYNRPTAYRNFLGLVAHEYFHLWNVKRLRPKALGPFDYETENYTSLLWMMEGFTSYYDNLILRRCAFCDEYDYLQLLAQDFNTVYNRPGYAVQSAGLASFDAWIKHYRPDENSHNNSISYYNKGAMLSAAMDIKIIADSKGRKRLDDVLKAAYEQFYLLENRGFEEDEFKQLAEEATSVDLTEIFQAVYKTEELDYNSYFNRIGYELIDLNADQKTLSLGIRTATQDGKIIIKAVDRNSSAWHAGLNVNDEIIAIDSTRVDLTGQVLEDALQSTHYGQYLDMMVARDGIIRTIKTMVGHNSRKNFVIQRKKNATEEEQRHGKLWLSLGEEKK